jgi:hypothetical protein
LGKERNFVADLNQPPVQPTGEVNTAPVSSFWSRNSKTIIRLLIVVIIIAAAYFYSRGKDVPVTEVNLAQEQAIGNGQADTGNPAPLAVTNQTGQGTPEVRTGTNETTQTIKVSGSTVTVTALAGNGYTHLARRALAEYLKSLPEQNLKPEQKIYIEDYLQKQITDKKPLYAGNQTSFSENQIQKAIDLSQGLSQKQIQNLSQYVPLIKSL